MIIDIRGTHGSGKSWIAHQLIKEYGNGVVVDDDNSTLGQNLQKLKSVVLGEYKTNCGGCDGIKDAAEIVRRVQLLHGPYRHVVLEGILVAHTFGRYSELAKTYQQGTYNFCFLNTPLKTCIARVLSRRRKKGNDKPLNPANIIRDWHCIWERVREKAMVAGHAVHVLDWKNPLPKVLELLKS